MNALLRIAATFAVLLAVRAAYGQSVTVPDDFPTIQEALDSAPGEIVVLPGEYTESLTISAPVTLRAQDGPRVTCLVFDTSVPVVAVGAVNGVTIAGFTLRGGSVVVDIASGANVTLANNVIQNSQHGVRAIWTGNAPITRLHLTNNIIRGHSSDAIRLIGPERAQILETPGRVEAFFIRMFNNVVMDNGHFGVHLRVQAADPTTAILQPQRMVIDYNALSANGSGHFGPRIVADAMGSTTQVEYGANNLFPADPMFVNEAGECGFDARLQEMSPLIDAGHPAPQFRDPDGSPNDLGPFGGPLAASFLTVPVIERLFVAPGVLPLGESVAVEAAAVVRETTSIQAAEYFITPGTGPEALTGAPGPGSGTPIAAPDDGAYGGPREQFAFTVTPADLDPGLHTLWFRARDAEDGWSTPRGAVFELAPPLTLVAAEWAAKPDVPFGQGVPMQAADGAFDSADEPLEFTGAPPFDAFPIGCRHPVVFVRVQDSLGRWSFWFLGAEGPLPEDAYVEINRPPVIDSIPSVSVPPGVELEFGVTGFDPDCDGVEWDVEGLPAGATFDVNSRVFSWTPIEADAGEHELRFTLTDDYARPLTVAAIMTITVGLDVPVLTVTPEEIEFPDVQINAGLSVTRSFTVKNTGQGTLAGAMSGLAAPFGLGAGSSADYSLGPGEEKKLSITFSPSSLGEFEQILSFTGGRGLERRLRGRGVSTPTPIIEVSIFQETVDPFGDMHYGTVNVGTSSARAFIVKNIGTGTLSGQAGITSNPYSVFEITAPSASYTLAPFDQTALLVRFTPPFGAYTFNGQIAFTGGGGAARRLIGAGSGACVLAPVTSSQGPDFGPVQIGRVMDHDFVVANTGANVIDGEVRVTGPFRVVRGGAYFLFPGESQVVRIRFTPESAGPIEGTASFTGCEGEQVLALTGLGVAAARGGVSISGLVTEAGKGGDGPAIRAAVAATHESTGRVYVVSTDARGGYSFQRLPSGGYELDVFAPGYERASAVLEPAADLRRFHDFALTPRTLDRSVFGTVTTTIDAGAGTGTFALAGVLVRAVADDEVFDFAYTGTDGSYEIAAPESKAGFTVEMLAFGFNDAAFDSPSGELNVNLAPKALVPGTIFGVVSDATGDAPVPLEGVNVWVNPVFQTITSVPVVTDAGGQYLVAGLGAATYDIKVSTEGFGVINVVSTKPDNAGHHRVDIPIAAVLDVQPAAGDFGTAIIGVTKDLVFTVRNTGVLPLSGQATLAGDAAFSLVGATSYELAPGAATTVRARFAPGAAGTFTATMNLTGGKGAAVALSGQGKVPGVIRVEPAILNFGAVTVGSSATITITVYNDGEGVLAGSAFVASPFEIISGASYAILQGGSHPVTVRFTPPGAGEFSRTITFSGGGDATATVRGMGRVPCVLSVAPASLNFGLVLVGENRVLGFTVSNPGQCTINGTATVPAGPFSIVSGGSYSLAPGASTVVQVRYQPTAAVSSSTIVTFTGGDAPVSRAVSGTADERDPIISVSPASIDFGEVVIGEGPVQAFTVTNIGGSILDGLATVLDAPSPFVIVEGGAYRLQPAESAEILIRFEPLVVGPFTGTIDFSGGGGETAYVSGVGVSTAVVSVTPPERDFGTVVLFDAARFTFRLSNTGTGLLIGSATVGAPFRIVSGGEYRLNPGQSQDIEVEFMPTLAGPVQRNLRFTGGMAEVVVVLRGTGDPGSPRIQVTPVQHIYGLGVPIPVGSFEDRAFSVVNLGTGPLVGAASVAAPFSVVEGGTYSVLPGVEHQVRVRFRPESGGTFTRVVSFSGGGGYDAQVVGHAQAGGGEGEGEGEGEPIIAVAPAGLADVPAAGGVFTLAVTNGGMGELEWDAEVVGNPGWITVTASKIIGDGEIEVSIAANSARSPRNAVIRVTSPNAANSPVDVAVTQRAAASGGACAASSGPVPLSRVLGDAFLAGAVALLLTRRARRRTAG